MTALSIVEDALNGIAAKKGSDALHIVEDALASYKNRGSLVQDEFAFDETPQETEGDGIAEGDGSESDEGEGLDLPDGVKVEKEGDDSVKFTFKFKYAPNKYDSTVDDGAKQGDDAEMKSGASEGDAGGEDEQVQVQEDLQVKVAEDALPPPAENAVTHASAQCKATFEECKAKNPYACKYHGQKLMEADLYALLAQNGAKTAKVELTEEKGVKGSFNAVVTCIDTPAEKKAAAKAIKAFLKKQGIDSESVIDFGYDKEEKSHSAFFDVDDLDKEAKSDDDMHVEQKQEKKPEPEVKEEEPKTEKEVTETVEAKEEVKEPVMKEYGASGITDEEILDSLKKVFGDKIEFDIGSSDFAMWKTAITNGVGTDGKALSDTNKGYLKKMVDELPDGDPVANVAAATLAQLNSESKFKEEWAKKQKKVKNKKSPQEVEGESESQGEETEGYSAEKFIALKNEGVEIGADKDADVTDKMQEVAAHVADMKKAEKTMDELSTAAAKVNADSDISDGVKDIMKNALSEAFNTASNEYTIASKEAGIALAEFEKAIKSFKMEKEKKAHVDAVEKVKAEVYAALPGYSGKVPEAVSQVVFAKTSEIMDECEKNGIYSPPIIEASGLGLAGKNAKIDSSSYGISMTDFDLLKKTKSLEGTEKLASAAKKVASEGKATVASLKKLDEAFALAKKLVKEKIEEKTKTKASAQSAQTAPAAPASQPSAPADKSAVKAKIAAMTPKEKAAKAIEIVQKKLAADPGNAELQKQLQKFQTLAAKLG